MPQDKFMIAPLTEGLITDVRPWLLPDKAFARLINAYVYRGRVRKRVGSRLMTGNLASDVEQLGSRLRINLGTTDVVTGNFVGVTPSATAAIGQMFSIGDTMFTVYQNGAMLVAKPVTPSVATGTVVLAGGNVTITGNTENPLTAVFWYPALPVMGLLTKEQDAINDEKLIAFDTRYSYEFTPNVGWSRLGTFTWSGTDYQFFWGTNYRGETTYDKIFYVTNFKNSEMAWLNPTATTWTQFLPIYAPAAGLDPDLHILTARIIIPFKGSLLLLNTVEEVAINHVATAKSFPQRMRFCTLLGSPLATEAYYEDAQFGGFEDATTSEAIISADFIKDRLIVYFENSTWEIVSTGNGVRPFVFQKINRELGTESTFSIVPFDKNLIGIGSTGIHACSGTNVIRIDQNIPGYVFQIQNDNNGVERVHGIRDYMTQQIYWTLPNAEGNPTFPNRMLVYNYEYQTWATNDDSFTCFGYYQNDVDLTWADIDKTWEEMSLAWEDGSLDAKFSNVVAGNQEGYVFIVDPDSTRNASSLQITNIAVAGNLRTVTITAINHNMMPEEFVAIEHAQGLTELNDQIFVIDVVTTDTIQLTTSFDVTGTYTGGGTLARVSQIEIETKQYNFYADKGKNVYVSKVDFLVDATDQGEIEVDYFVSDSPLSMVEQAIDTESILGTSILETRPYTTIPFEQTQEMLWHTMYFQASGEFIQLNLFMNEEQMTDIDIAWSDFQLHAMTFYAQPTGRLQ